MNAHSSPVENRQISRCIRIGVLGCGPIAQAAHLEGVRRAHNAELYAICDVAPDLRERMFTVHQPRKQFERYEDLLSDHEIDAVIIATADAFHVPAALQAVKAGKHVLVEKPLSSQLEESIELQQLLRHTNLHFQVGHMKRFDPGIQFAHRFINESIGELLALKAWYCDSTNRYTLTDNVQPIILHSTSAKKPLVDPKANKGRYFMLAHGSHLIDTRVGDRISAGFPNCLNISRPRVVFS